MDREEGGGRDKKEGGGIIKIKILIKFALPRP